jgi:hypothetical protein
LHSTPHLGELTERWIEIQAEAADRYGSRLIGNSVAEGASPQPYWLDATSRIDARAAYGLMFAARGLPLAGLSWSLRKSPPSVVHVHYGLYGAQHIPLARRLHAPLVTSFYGYDATEERFTRGERPWGRRYARLFDGADAFVAEGPAMGRRLEALGCPVTKIHVVRLPAAWKRSRRSGPTRSPSRWAAASPRRRASTRASARSRRLCAAVTRGS